MTAHHRNRSSAGATKIVVAALCLWCLLAAAASGAVPAWTTYRHDAARSGIDPESTSPLPPVQAWQSAVLDGSIYGQPLVYGPRVYVATENDTVYSLNASTGAVAWEAHLAAPVPSGLLPCGDIGPTVGITSTPVIDPSTNTIYAVMDTWDGVHKESIKHELLALDLATGAERQGFPYAVDPPFPHGSGGSAVNQLQRASLALDGGEIVIGYGGNDGDCATYWGWLVGASETPGEPLLSYQVDSGTGHHEGAVWGAGNAPAVDASGDIYASTGNGSSGSEYDFGDSVLKLSKGLGLIESWAPEDWQHLDETDADLGSSDPVILPDGFAFEIGKQGIGYLLRAADLGGAGAAPAAELSVCPGSWGGGIFASSTEGSGTLYLTCDDGVHSVSVTGLKTASPALSLTPGWKVNSAVVGPPILAGGMVWVASQENGHLYGLAASTGAVRFEDALGSFVHFSSPSAAGGRLFAANGDRVTAVTIASAPAPSATSASLSSSTDPSVPGQGVTFTAAVSPVPDGGTIAFTDGGAPIPGCSAVPVSESGGEATCQASYPQPGSHAILAAYSGDPYFAGSTSPQLDQVVSSPITGEALPLPVHSEPPAVARPILSGLRERHLLWREGRRPALVSAAGPRAARRPAPVGTSFSFTLNEQASVTFRFTRLAGGTTVGGRCVAARPGYPRGRRCVQSLLAGTLVFAGRDGGNSVAIDGRISRSRLLALGRYRLTVVATNAQGSSSPASLAFTIVG